MLGVKLTQHFVISLLFVVGMREGIAWGQPPPTIIKVYVKGMVCSFCSQGLIKTIKNQAGVAKAQASLEEHSITIYLKPDAKLESQKITELVEDGGYSVERIETAL